MKPLNKSLLNLSADTIRFLAIDAIEKSRSGHPGMPMGMAKTAAYLFTRHLRFDPTDPNWRDRDRFVLSAGHGSMLLYSLLHLCGYDVTLEDIKNFRQWGSRTPGHPEYGETAGVETTTGPLGQGFAHGVGMALAAKMLHARLQREDDWNPVGHKVVGIVSDGDLMEGAAAEAASFAGHHKLDNLLYFYDSNSITIEGGTDLTFSDDIPKRFEALGWKVVSCSGRDYDSMETAMQEVMEDEGKPKMVVVRTHIGWGSPNKQDTPDCHGAPLGPEEAALTKEVLGWKEHPDFHVPDEVREFFRQSVKPRQREREIWQSQFDGWKERNPDLYEIWKLHCEPDPWPENLYQIILDAMPGEAAPTRKLSGLALNAAAKLHPRLVGGSADLAPSNKTMIDGADDVGPGRYLGRNLRFGIRELAMGAITNGINLYGAFRGYCGTFFVFSDFMRPAVRLAALMKLNSLFVYTHDSFYVGEDGPTHQPIEQLEAMRLIPNLELWRPACGEEVAAAYARALRRENGPCALVFSRQKLPVLDLPSTANEDSISRGGYIAWEPEGGPEAVVVATGSEVHVAIDAAKKLARKGRKLRVVSMPCREVFLAQEYEYRREILPHKMPKAVVEAGTPGGWWRIAGSHGLVIGMEQFGRSAPGGVLAEKFGFTADAVTGKISDWLDKKDERKA